MKKMTYAIMGSLLFLSASAVFADSCDQAAYFYKKGQYRSAITIISPLLKKGEACAEYYMGKMYYEGYGVKPNEKKALKLIRKAEAKGYPLAKSFMNSYH